jgi:glutamate formiminotransferase
MLCSLHEKFSVFSGCWSHLDEEDRRRMLRPMLACCKLYVSEGRSAAALRAVEQAARRHHPAVVLVNTFVDDAYNRVGYTLVSRLTLNAAAPAPSSPVSRAVFGVVGAALEAIDLGAHAGAHPRLGAVDHVCFHPLAGASLRDVATLAADVGAGIGDALQGNRQIPSEFPACHSFCGVITGAQILPWAVTVPTFLYGAAHREGRTLAAIRRQLGYFNTPRDAQWRGPLPLAAAGTDAAPLPVAPDAGPDTPSASKGVLVLGATAWVDNYNVPVRTADVDAVRRIARRVSERGGGLRSVQAMGLAHGDGGTEVACNLLDPRNVGAGEVQDMVARLAKEQGFDVGEGYFTDFSEEKIVEMYSQKSAQAEAFS